MSWATAATLVGAGAFLALILVISYIIYNQGKRIGRQEGIEDEAKKVSGATKDLADKLYHGNPLFRVSDDDSWKAVTPKTNDVSGVAQGRDNGQSGQPDRSDVPDTK